MIPDMLTAVQIALPVLLIGWVFLLPAPSAIGFYMQTVAVGTVLVALALVGLWIALPWWTVHALGLVFVVVVASRRARGRRAGRGVLPRTARDWIGIAVSLGIAAVGISGIAAGLLARSPPDLETVDLAAPFEAGTYIVAHGGSREIVNGHMMTLDETVPRFAAWRGQSHAVDLVRVDGLGLAGRIPWSTRPEAYLTFGTPVVSPCTGRVVAREDGRADMLLPRMDSAHMLGNHVILECGGAWVVLAHFKRGSVAVKPGDDVTVGARLGLAGNSGNSSAPHLHIHAQRPEGSVDQPIAAEPLAITIEGRRLIRNDRLRLP